MIDSRTGLSIQNCLTSKMKFLADIGISLRTGSCLRGDGYDVVHLQDEDLQRLPDNQILIKARTEGRILLIKRLFEKCFAVTLGTSRSPLAFLRGEPESKSPNLSGDLEGSRTFCYRQEGFSNIL
ncbi:DUF5615 family PIN-like protein [Nostoc sp.]|uniref:DUF5615 family PIN-like protein n=1 Tax=Nostoc sp. TaxID=1180 RepID=UPI002FF6B825